VVCVGVVERAGKSIHSCDSWRSLLGEVGKVNVAVLSGSWAVAGREAGAKVGWRNAIL